MEQQQKNNDVKKEKRYIPGKNIPENVIFSCFGCMSNTGLLAGVASLEAVKKAGLKKVGIGCLGGIPLKVPTVIQKAKASKKILAVDGCGQRCAKNLLEQGGFQPISVMMADALGIKKFSLSKDIPTGNEQSMMDYVSQDQIENAANKILEHLDPKQKL